MPEILGQYEIMGRIAMGGMAEVLHAHQRSDAGFEKEVVIKRILPQFAEDADFISMFQDEALLVAKLNHPNIVQVYDFAHVDGSYFIAMEYVEGVDLRRLTQYAAKAKQPIGENRALQIALAIARALGHAHERSFNGEPLKIVHRDVSPHNVLVSLAGDVKVMDFGIAKAAARATRTSTGMLKGKVSYMSPEQALGAPDVDHRTDIYAAGVLLWEMLTGERLFRGDSEIEILVKVQRSDVKPIRQVLPNIGADLEAIVNKFLAPNKEDRYQRMRDAERDLGKALTERGGPQAAPLDEYAEAIVPKEVVQGLKGLSQREPKPETQTKYDTTVLFEATNDELVAPRSNATITHMPTITATPIHPERAKWIVPAAFGLVMILVGVGIGALFSRRPAPQPEAPAPVFQVPVKVEEPAPPIPSAPPVEARVAPAPEEPVKEKKARPVVEKPLPIAKGMISFMGCPRGSHVLEAARDIATLASGSQRNVSLPVGSHDLTLKTKEGQTQKLKRVTVRAGDNELIDCSDL